MPRAPLMGSKFKTEQEVPLRTRSIIHLLLSTSPRSNLPGSATREIEQNVRWVVAQQSFFLQQSKDFLQRLKENYYPERWFSSSNMFGLPSTLENAIAIFLSTLEEEAEKGASACTRREWVSSCLPLNCPRTRATRRIRDRYVERFFFLSLFSPFPLRFFFQHSQLGLLVNTQLTDDSITSWRCDAACCRYYALYTSILTVYADN